MSLTLNKGETVAIVGANGAGKTTTLRAVSGLLDHAGQQGSIQFHGQEISHMSPDKIASMGLIQTLEGRHIFPHLSVMENLEIGAYTRKRNEIREDLDYVFQLFPRLKERERQMGGTLSGGEQQMLAVGRALMAKPEILMMDEPSLGLAPIVVRGVFDIIREINRQGKTILLVEQNANMALHAANHGYVMETGRITLSGTGEELAANESVKAAYLGKQRKN